MLAFRDIAEAMGESQLVLARRVAQLERVALGVEDAPWVPRDMAVVDVRRWAQDTALNATEHWLLMRGMLALAGKPVAYGAKLAAIDVKREASNEKKF